MSNKPVKKSEKWLQSRRDRKISIAPEYHLIVSEGEKTEPNYFEGLKREINKQYPGRISIEIKGIGKGANTLTLLEKAQKIVQQNPDRYKHIWLVYDKDDFPSDDFDNTFYRCKSLSEGSDAKYHALWSNECIEYWFLLHFEYLSAALHRNGYFPKLSEHLGIKYKKNSKDIYDRLKPQLETAIKNAKKILEKHGDGTPPSACTPGTTVYQLFEKLQKYI